MPLAVYLSLTHHYMHIIEYDIKNVKHIHTHSITDKGQGQERGKKMGRKEG